MKIKNADGLSMHELQHELRQGGKFVMYTYTISIVVLTFKRPSDIYFVRSGQNRTVKGLPFTLTSLLLGWWGFPWGPVHTVGSVFRNLSGGKDVTAEILQAMNAPASDLADPNEVL